MYFFNNTKPFLFFGQFCEIEMLNMCMKSVKKTQWPPPECKNVILCCTDGERRGEYSLHQMPPVGWHFQNKGFVMILYDLDKSLKGYICFSKRRNVRRNVECLAQDVNMNL